MKFIFCCVALLSSGFLTAQDSTQVICSFQASYEGKAISHDETSFLADSIQLEELKFYVTNFVLRNGDEIVFKEPHSYHLVDWQEAASLSISLTIPTNLQYNQVTFDLGVDSLTHVSGAFGGDLDPMHGMYWTWQSGYINFKLEGTSPSCPARQNRFQFHIGGYQHPHASMRRIELGVQPSERHLVILHLDTIFAQLTLREAYQLMRPGAAATAFADLLTNIFSIGHE